MTPTSPRTHQKCLRLLKLLTARKDGRCDTATRLLMKPKARATTVLWLRLWLQIVLIGCAIIIIITDEEQTSSWTVSAFQQPQSSFPSVSLLDPIFRSNRGGSSRTTTTTTRKSIRTTNRYMWSDEGHDGDDDDPDSALLSSSSPPCYWTSRRGIIESTTASLTALSLITPYLFPSSVSAAKPPSTSSSTASPDDYSFIQSPRMMMMADPSITIPTINNRRVLNLLQQQTDEALLQVTERHKQEYREWGVTKVENVITDRWLSLLQDGCEIAQDEAGPYAEYLNRPTDEGIFFTDLELARRLSLFSAFSMYSPAGAIAGCVMMDESTEESTTTTTRYLYDQLFVKEAGCTTSTPWHQDGGYWRVKGNLSSVFLPMDDYVSAKNGLQFVKGSNVWQLHNPHHFADGTPYQGTSLPKMPNIDQMVADKEIELLEFDLKAGDVLVFSAKTVHGGSGNWGRALSTRWVGSDTTFWDRPGEGAIPTINMEGWLKDGESLSNAPNIFPTCSSASRV